MPSPALLKAFERNLELFGAEGEDRALKAKLNTALKACKDVTDIDGDSRTCEFDLPFAFLFDHNIINF